MNTLQLQFLMLMFAGWVNRSQQEVIEYLQEENRVLREQLRGKRLLFTDGPRRRLTAKAKAIGRKGLFIRWNLHYVGARFANNSNTAGSGDYVVSNPHAGYALRLGEFELTPFVGLNNIGDEKYIDNLRLNAAGERYFEPAPEFNAYGGLSLKYRFGFDPRDE